LEEIWSKSYRGSCVVFCKVIITVLKDWDYIILIGILIRLQVPCLSY
jgi:hypothetical protein